MLIFNRMSEYWSIFGIIATGIGALATAWMACQTLKSNRNAKESILEGKKSAFFDMIAAMYSNSRKIIEQMPVNCDDCTMSPKPFGLECLKYVYDNLFKNRLTTYINRNLPLSEQNEELVIPEKEAVKQAFEKIVFDRYPNIGTYLSSVVDIMGMIDEEKILDDEYKHKCIAYIKSQMTIDERLWLYYYSLYKYDKSGMLNRYSILADIPNERLIVMQ